MVLSTVRRGSLNLANRSLLGQSYTCTQGLPPLYSSPVPVSLVAPATRGGPLRLLLNPAYWDQIQPKSRYSLLSRLPRIPTASPLLPRSLKGSDFPPAPEHPSPCHWHSP